MEFKDLEIGKTYVSPERGLEVVISGFNKERVVTTCDMPINPVSYRPRHREENPMCIEGHFGFSTGEFLKQFKRKESNGI